MGCTPTNLGAKKIIHLVLTKPIADDKIYRVKAIEKKSDFEYTLEVYIGNKSISSFIQSLTEMCEFSNISIKELPMEKIITKIYESKVEAIYI